MNFALAACLIASGVITSIACFYIGFSVGKNKGRSIGWHEGREYEIAQAKIRRDKRGRYKHRNDSNQFTATI